MSKIQDALNKLKTSDSSSSKEGASRERALLSTKGGPLQSVHPADIQGMSEPLLRSADELSKLKIISAAMNDEHVLNAFREIRTSIIRSVNSEDSVILVASTDREAGTSFVAMNLAAAFSLEEDKTSLVVDCDVRSPSLDKYVVHDGAMLGLRDYLTKSGIDVADIIYPSGIPRLRIIPSGTDGVPLGEYFTTPRLKDLFLELRSRYPERYIFIDAPPVSNSPDARILADICDHVILVVPYGKTTETQVGAVIDAIGEDKLLGVIFNNSP